MRKASIILASILFLCVLSGCSDNSGNSGISPSDSPAAKVLENGDELIDKDQLKPSDSGMKLGDQDSLPAEGEEIAVITMESGEVIKLRFFPDEAPKTVYNFKKHAIDGYYDGLTFHRIIDDFMIQGGDPQGDSTGGESVWGDKFEDEFSENLVNITGSVAMANSGQDTNGSQFFINYAPNAEIQWDVFEDYYNFYEQDPDQADEIGLSGSVLDVNKISDEYQSLYDKYGGSPQLDGYYKANNTGHTVFAQVFEGLDVVETISKTEVSSDTSMPITPVVIESVEIVTYEG